MSEVYLIGGMRTPIGKTGGFLKDVLPEELASVVLNQVVEKYKVPVLAIDQVVFGNAVGPGGNITRVSILEAGWPYSTSALTVDSQCGSGLSAIQVGTHQIMAGEADLVIAGGVESTSMAPRRHFNPTDPRFQGENVYYDRAPFSTPAIGDPDIGEAAEHLAKLMNISRKEMDQLALESHRRAERTRDQGLFHDIMAPVSVAGNVIDSDECIRKNMSLKLLERMKPVFVAGGQITAGNTCLKHDGAAVILMASEQAVKKYNLKPQALIRGTVTVGCDPNLFPLSPVPAIEKLVNKYGLKLTDIDALEMNEAFAVKIIACCRKLNISLEKTNQLGGALAYGHPYGASGAIILLHLLKALEQINGRLGIASIGAVGGMGSATLIERC